MPYLHVYGYNLVYDRWGEGSPCVLIGYAADDWAGCDLPPGRRYVAVDLPGHGRSEGDAGLADDELAEYLVSFLMLQHLTEAELWVHPRARAIGDYLSERLSLDVSPAPGCSEASLEDRADS
ncbi:alpha/beta hydrolase [Oceanithermus sp.]|uniref:alpha/beta hydrolase n=1 Tax=Oceanithermus sp. TaxID=2268145 RepID=UPI0025E8660D|nr:alpha/beta hydrolase [Oceanithermus sp.]